MDDHTAELINELRGENKLLRADIKRLNERIEYLQKENRQLREELEKAQRQMARQAAPFRRDERKKIPPDKHKPSGRKSGHPGCCRKEPDHIDEMIEMPLDNCPKCSWPVKNVERIEQIIEEIPPVRPRVVKLITYRGECARCGSVGTYHPLQTSYGQGAAKVQLGPRALAVAACLNKVHGLTMRKTCRVLYDLCGLRITAGGLSQALSRMASRVKWIYEQLIEEIRGSPAVFADETSWWVGGPKYWLWVFTTAERTVYRVEHSRGSAVVRDILGDDFDGMLVSDCLSSYDPADYEKHKCIAHHLRAISRAAKYPRTDDSGYLLAWRRFFHGVIALYILTYVSPVRCCMTLVS
jgi:transposase